MLTKLDRYIIGKFVKTFFFGICLIMSIGIIFDISEKIDDFLRNEPPLKALIFDYYVNFTLNYAVMLSGLFIFISCIFFTSIMAAKTEIVAILAAGVSFKRLLRPYMLAATLFTGLSLYAQHWLIPEANKTRLAFEYKYIGGNYDSSDRNIHRKISPNESIFFAQYRKSDDTGVHFSYEKWDDGILITKIDAEGLKWDDEKQTWVLKQYRIRKVNGVHETIERGLKKDTLFDFRPKDFETRLTDTEMMNFSELSSFIDEERENGSKYVVAHEIVKHQRTSFPFATYVLTLVGFSISSRKKRGGIGAHLAVGLLIGFMYIWVMKVSTVYATNAGLDPLIAVWIPNFLFGGIGVYLFKNAPK